jgi:hypothetical protein
MLDDRRCSNDDRPIIAFPNDRAMTLFHFRMLLYEYPPQSFHDPQAQI